MSHGLRIPKPRPFIIPKKRGLKLKFYVTQDGKDWIAKNKKSELKYLSRKSVKELYMRYPFGIRKQVRFIGYVPPRRGFVVNMNTDKYTGFNVLLLAPYEDPDVSRRLVMYILSNISVKLVQGTMEYDNYVRDLQKGEVGLFGKLEPFEDCVRHYALYKFGKIIDMKTRTPQRLIDIRLIDDLVKKVASK